MVHSFGEASERWGSITRAAIGDGMSLAAPSGLRDLAGKIREDAGACIWRFANRRWRFAT